MIDLGAFPRQVKVFCKKPLQQRGCTFLKIKLYVAQKTHNFSKQLREIC